MDLHQSHSISPHLMRNAIRRIIATIAIVIGSAFFAFLYLTSLNPAQQTFAEALQLVEGIVDPVAEKPRTVSVTLELLRGKGLPDKLIGERIPLKFASPDKLRLSAKVDGEFLVLGRAANEIWIWQPAKNFAVQGVQGVPLFATNPARLDATELAPLVTHVSDLHLAIAPALLQVEALPDETVDAVSCRVLSATPLPTLQKLLGVGAATLTLWVRQDGFPIRIGYRDASGKTDVLVALHDLKLDPVLPPETWILPATDGASVERVALRHLQRFMGSALGMISKPKLAPLGPVTGSRKIIATAGNGRLEERDGTQVLFLKGTPEEMGTQHGSLLQHGVRDLVSNILYGVGVGSSFSKGEWFFGTIERCQSRLQPFVDPRYTREMNAMASAARIDAEEMQLSNFFPELFHCSGFALTGASTRDGHIYHGRILDYMKGVGLEPNAVVMVMQPDQGHAWVNIGYAGFVGSVTAMNDQHLSIGEMGGHGEGHWDGKPMAQLVREVMEKADTLDEAIAIMRDSPRTCEYYYVIADGKTRQAVGIKATHDSFNLLRPGESHPDAALPVKDTVLLSGGDRYKELSKRVKTDWGQFDAHTARALMTRPVCMNSNIHSVLFQPDTLDFWVANADDANPASHTRYTHYNLGELLNPNAADTAASNKH
jgi:hypothetical protein